MTELTATGLTFSMLRMAHDPVIKLEALFAVSVLSKATGVFLPTTSLL
jgi:hypothetical protein